MNEECFPGRIRHVLGDRGDPVVEINGRFIACGLQTVSCDDVRLLARHFWEEVGKKVEHEEPDGTWKVMDADSKLAVVARMKFRIT